MFWGWSISKKDLLQRQYNLSKEIEALNKEIEILEGRISDLENKGAKKKPGKKPVQKKPDISPASVFIPPAPIPPHGNSLSLLIMARRDAKG